jgi:hypothetical protein
VYASCSSRRYVESHTISAEPAGADELTGDGLWFQLRLCGGATWRASGSSSPSITFGPLLNGPVCVEVRGVDGAGNVQRPPYATTSTTIDTEAPVVVFTPPLPLWTDNANLTVCVTVLDASPATVDWAPSVDSGALTAVLSSLSSGGTNGTHCAAVTVLQEGLLVLALAATDAAGNASPSLESVVGLDTTAPVSELTYNPCTATFRGLRVCGQSAVMAPRLACAPESSLTPSSPCTPQWTGFAEALHTVEQIVFEPTAGEWASGTDAELEAAVQAVRVTVGRMHRGRLCFVLFVWVSLAVMLTLFVCIRWCAGSITGGCHAWHSVPPSGG